MVTVNFRSNVPYFRCLKTEWQEMGGYKGFLSLYSISIREIKDVKHEVLPSSEYPTQEWEA